jgi:hypothetical protein
MVYEARGDNQKAADCYRKVIDFMGAHPDDDDDSFEDIFARPGRLFGGPKFTIPEAPKPRPSHAATTKHWFHPESPWPRHSGRARFADTKRRSQTAPPPRRHQPEPTTEADIQPIPDGAWTHLSFE